MLLLSLLLLLLLLLLMLRRVHWGVQAVRLPILLQAQ